MSKKLEIIVEEINLPSEKALQSFAQNCYQYILANPKEKLNITNCKASN